MAEVETMSLRFDQRREYFEHALVGHLTASEQPLHVVTGMPGNIGDHLIWRGTDDLMKRHGLDPHSISMAEVLSSRTPTVGTLVVPGSGALDDQWGDWLPELVMGASARFDRVVILPSGVSKVSRLVQNMMRLPNVQCFARDVGSYRALREFGQTALAMDCALSFDGFRGINHADIESWTLLALRSDAGSRLDVDGVEPQLEINDDISATSESLEAWLHAICSARVVVTDRLHVVVASVMFGRRTYFVEAYDRKIRSYVDFTFRDAFHDHLSEVDSSWLLEAGFARAMSDETAA